jgi:NADH dehydrogenase [ubiquinone] 1 alpha subcomplex assembly factor 7
MSSPALPLDLFFVSSAEKYYKTRSNIISRSGDFITAPEASQMFCHSIAAWIYNKISNIESISVVELGPGYGTLSDEIITFLKQDISFIKKIKNFYFLESSPQMISNQKEKLSKHTEIQFNWIENISDLQRGNFIFIANEFFDALPVKQFIKTNEVFREILVDEEGNLVQSDEVIEASQMEKIMQFSNSKPDDFNDGDIFEISISSLSTLNTICEVLERGNVLIIDYGYFTSKRKNTIQAISQHKILDSFTQIPGEADISAQVDFGSMMNFLHSRYSDIKQKSSTQKQFLKENYIDEIAKKAMMHAKNDAELKLVDMELERILVDMGEIFKVVELQK